MGIVLFAALLVSILELGLQGRVGFSVFAWSLCFKAPLHAEGSEGRCCGP